MKYQSSLEPRQLNRTFLSYVSQKGGEGLTKLAQAGAAFVRDHLREEGACRRIINPENLSPTSQRVIPALNSDTLVVRKDLEPRSRAMALTFGSQPHARIVSARRIDIPVITVSSELFEVREQHLLAYEEPITKIIEENTAKDIQEVEDLEWLVHSEASVAATANITLGEQAAADVASFGANTGFRGELQRPDFVNIANALIENGNRKRLDKIWMNDVDYNNILKWTVEDMGDSKESETLIDGYRYDQVLGHKVVRTVKTDLLQTGNVYGYAAKEFLGFFFVLNDVKFYIDKRANLILWQCWEDIALSISNISSVAKLKLYNTTAEDTLPDEDDLFTQTNPADEPGGAYFPQVTLL